MSSGPISTSLTYGAEIIQGRFSVKRMKMESIDMPTGLGSSDKISLK